MFKRNIYNLILELLQDFRIVYITGPRQSGKSTLANIVADETMMKYYTLDNQAYAESAKSDPHGLIASLGKKIVIDEFQYAPSLISAIKMVSDSLTPDEKGIFLLTGSSDIFKSALTQEALPGHMARIELFPLSIAEVKNTDFNIVDYLWGNSLKPFDGEFTDRKTIADILIKGGYPEVLGKSKKSRKKWFKSYIEGRLFKDFEKLANTKGDYISRLSALVRMLAGLSGNLIKYASISNNIKLDDKTVKKYMSILELMFIVCPVRPYVRNQSKRDVIGMSKLHFIDTGLASYLLGLNTTKVMLSSKFYGGLLENFITMEIIKHGQWSNEDVRLFHFRDKRQNEVDIVLEYEDLKIVGIEVKASSSVKPDDFKGLYELSVYAKERFLRGVLFYTGDRLLPFKYRSQIFHAVPFSFLWNGQNSTT